MLFKFLINMHENNYKDYVLLTSSVRKLQLNKLLLSFNPTASEVIDYRSQIAAKFVLYLFQV